MGSPNIFIGYRREDGAGWAGRLHADLRARLGPASQIFMDVDGIPPGADFRTYIDGAIGQCDAFVALIGPNWLDARDDLGRRRLDDPHDFVRLEIGAALKRDIRVIPVLVGGAHLPPAEELPEPIGRLVDRHAVSLDNETWDLGVNRIVGSFGERTDPQQPLLTLSTRRRDSGTPRSYRISGIVLVLAVTLVLMVGVAATVLGRSLSQPASVAPSTPTPTLPAATGTIPPGTTSPPETTTPRPTETTSPPRTTAPAPPPEQVVEDYYDAINARDYRAAWALVGGTKFGQTYEEFTAGFARTVHDRVTITARNGDTVTVELAATESDGSTDIYRGSYTVRAGRIVEGHLRRVG